ncbi:restriction endonuclease subunit S [Lentilactobacillus sp. Marseille-Q4993]|uniref:restriction endonuclease subunit S n=1 Tax=Lentilactobacillus sp. Marseille-Q4993 TaxID=3039492 RepID=UPI0024BD2E2D|nr:restriction endonuclease subunit S [Lentilactobacillus sp. Marseille-Q4993]
MSKNHDAWEQRKFNYLLTAKDGIRRGPFGSSLKKDFFVKNGQYAVYEQKNAIYDNYEVRYEISADRFNKLKSFELKPGDYILSGAGTIGKISRVPNGIKKGVFNQALIRIRINHDLVNDIYFLEFMRSESMQRKLTSTNPGSAITNLVPMKTVKDFEVSVPKIEEQKKVGLFLVTVSNLITANQRQHKSHPSSTESGIFSSLYQTCQMLHHFIIILVLQLLDYV